MPAWLLRRSVELPRSRPRAASRGGPLPPLPRGRGPWRSFPPPAAPTFAPRMGCVGGPPARRARGPACFLLLAVPPASLESTPASKDIDRRSSESPPLPPPAAPAAASCPGPAHGARGVRRARAHSFAGGDRRTRNQQGPTGRRLSSRPRRLSGQRRGARPCSLLSGGGSHDLIRRRA